MTFTEWLEAYHDHLTTMDFVDEECRDAQEKLTVLCWMKRVWEAEGEVVKSDRGLKVGCVTLTTIREIELPKVSRNKKIAFAILCAKKVYKGAEWNLWTDKWLSGEDRSKADAAAYAAAAAAEFDLIAVALQAMEY